MKKLFSIITVLCLLAGIIVPANNAKAADLSVKELLIECNSTPIEIDNYTHFEINTATVTFSNGKKAVLCSGDNSFIEQSKDDLSYSMGIQFLPMYNLYALNVEIYDEKNDVWIDEISGDCKAYVNGQSWETKVTNTPGLNFYSKTPPKATANSIAIAKAITDARAVIGKGYCARIRNKVNNDHIFTLDPAEAESLLKQSSIYEHETSSDGSNSFQASLTKTGPFDLGVYAILNKNTNLHLYTHMENEMNTLLGNEKWIADKGTEPLFYTISKSENGTMGIYRAFNPKNGKQHYCPQKEYNALIANHGWMPNYDSKPLWYTN